MTYDTAPIPGYDPEIGLLLAAMADGTREGREELGDVDEDTLVWQPYPGAHSIGAILLHIGDCENYWIEEVTAGRTTPPELLKKLLSEETKQYENEWPVPPRMPLADYYAILDEIHARTLETMRAYTDPAEFRTTQRETVSIRWILAHVVEHESYHLGQAVLLKALKGRS